MTTGPVLSPVDYRAWERGYMPPTEHILIDALHYRGAKVFGMSSAGPTSVWVVYQTADGTLTKANRSVLRKLFHSALEDLDMLDEPTAPPMLPQQGPGLVDGKGE